MKSFPLGDMEICYAELRRDLLYDKIPAHVRQEICRRAWETGVRAAWGQVDKGQADKGQADKGQADKGQMAEIGRLIEKQKLGIQRLEKDWVVGGMRFFGEYVDRQKKIILYNGSVSRLAGSCGLSHAQAEELILAHEYYHFLECTCLGRTSRQYTVPAFRWGRLSVGKNEIRALSEIGAHGFSCTYWKLRYGIDEKEEKGQVLV